MIIRKKTKTIPNKLPYENGTYTTSQQDILNYE